MVEEQAGVPEGDEGSTDPAEEAWRDAIESHCDRYLGPCPNVIAETSSDLVRIDLDPYLPAHNRERTTVVTVGVSTKATSAPDAMASYRHIELFSYLPANWSYGTDEVHWWPCRMLKDVGRLVHRLETWYAPGQLLGGDPDEPLTDESLLTGVVLLPPVYEDPAFDQLEIEGTSCRFLWAFPLTTPEIEFAQDRGVSRLLELMAERDVELPLDNRRACMITGKKYGVAGASTTPAKADPERVPQPVSEPPRQPAPAPPSGAPRPAAPQHPSSPQRQPAPPQPGQRVPHSQPQQPAAGPPQAHEPYGGASAQPPAYGPHGAPPAQPPAPQQPYGPPQQGRYGPPQPYPGQQQYQPQQPHQPQQPYQPQPGQQYGPPQQYGQQYGPPQQGGYGPQNPYPQGAPGYQQGQYQQPGYQQGQYQQGQYQQQGPYGGQQQPPPAPAPAQPSAPSSARESPELWNKILSGIEQRLHRLLQTDGFLVVEEAMTGYYVMLASSRQRGTLTCEAVSNQFLPTGRRLDGDQEQRMRTLGWSPPGQGEASGTWNHARTLHVPVKAPGVARVAVTTLRDVYGCDPRRLRYTGNPSAVADINEPFTPS